MTLASLPVFDAHVDSIQRALDLGHDLGCETPGHLDLARGRSGGLGAVVLTAWVDPSYIGREGGGAPQRARDLIGSLHALLDTHPKLAAWAGNGDQLRAIRESGRIAAIGGIEGGHAIDGSLKKLQEFFEYGVRMLTLVWNNHLPWIRSCQPQAGPDVPAGISEFGRDVVREMNRMGMVVDLSHASERAVMDVLEVSEKPTIASHSACKALNDHPRNLSDDALRALAAHGGVLGVVLCTPFLSADARKEEGSLRLRPEYKRLVGKDDTETHSLQSEFIQSEASPFSIDVVVQHIVHAIEVMGIEHVGLGSDFDGIQRTPAELSHAGQYPNLAKALLRAGLSEDHVQRVFWGNMQRVFDEATGPGTAAQTQELRPIR